MAMQKAIVALTIAALMLVSSTAPFLPAQAEAADVIVVPDDFPTITQAVQNATDGDTVLVRRGIYNESQILIDKAITLRGEDTNQTVIYRKNTGNIFFIKHDGVTVTGFTIHYSQTKNTPKTYWVHYLPTYFGSSDASLLNAAMLAKPGDFDASGCPKDHGYNTGFDDRGFVCIQFLNASYCTLSGNRIYDTCFGVYLYGSANNTIAGNEFVRTNYAIQLEASPNNTVTANTFKDGGAGIYFDPILSFPNNYIADPLNANNTVSLNNFIGNKYPIERTFLTDQFKNYWDDGRKGNYWGQNYSGVDKNTDGIGDVPYKITGDFYTGGYQRKGVWVTQIHGVDNYPLMKPFDTASMFASYQAPTSTLPATHQPEPTQHTTVHAALVMVAAICVFATAAVGIIFYAKKHRHKSLNPFK